MAVEFPRRVDGYNFPFLVEGSGSLARNAWLTVNAPIGPGRIEAGFIRIGEITATTPLSNVVTLTVDGVAVFSVAIATFLGTVISVSGSTPWASRLTGPSYSTFHWLLNFDYEGSASIAVQNTTSPDPTWFYMTFAGRRGL